MENKDLKLYKEMYGIPPEKRKRNLIKGFRGDLEIHFQIINDNLYSVEAELCASKLHKTNDSIGRIIR